MFASKLGPLLSPSFIWLRSTPVSGDHGEGQVLAVLALDRGDKSLSTPEDSLPVGKLGTSLSRPCHTLPCRSSLIGLPLWRAQPYFCHCQRSLRSVSALRRRENRKILRGSGKFSLIPPQYRNVWYKNIAIELVYVDVCNTTKIWARIFCVNSTVL